MFKKYIFTVYTNCYFSKSKFGFFHCQNTYLQQKEKKVDSEIYGKNLIKVFWALALGFAFLQW